MGDEIIDWPKALIFILTNMFPYLFLLFRDSITIICDSEDEKKLWIQNVSQLQKLQQLKDVRKADGQSNLKISSIAWYCVCTFGCVTSLWPLLSVCWSLGLLVDRSVGLSVDRSVITS